MAYQWELIGRHPFTGDRISVIHREECEIEEAIFIAEQMLDTFDLSGIYLPTINCDSKEGFYIFNYVIFGAKRIGTIFAFSFDDAVDRMCAFVEAREINICLS